MSTFNLRVNDTSYRVESWDPDQPLLYVLRNNLRLHGAKYGCGEGQCGSCTVLIDNRPARACLVSVAAAAGKRITTIEGVGSPARPHPVQAAFIAEQAAQCGYCTNGMVMAAVGLLSVTPRPSLDQAKAALEGIVCRCGSHDRVLRAVQRAAGTLVEKA